MEGNPLSILMVGAMGAAPGIFWLWYFARRDKVEPEPAKYLIGMYFWGMLSIIPALIVQIPASKFLSKGLLWVIVAPVTEEFSKCFFLVWALKAFSGLRKEFDEPMDGIVYAAAVALGFASVENIGYLAHATIKGHLTMVFIIRSIFSVPGHVLFSGLWGYALGMSKFFKSKTVAGGLGLAIIFHGIFNGLAFLGAVLSALLPIVLLIVAVLVFWKIITRRIDEALIVSPHRKPGDKEG